jgi:hypothetical protein
LAVITTVGWEQVTVKLFPDGLKLNETGAGIGFILKLAVVVQPPAATIKALYCPGAIPPIAEVWIELVMPLGMGDQLTV